MYTNRIPELTNPFEAFIVPPVAEDLAFLDDTNRVEFGVPLVRGFVTVDVDGPEFTVSLHVQDEPGARCSRTFPAPGRLTSPTFQSSGEFTCTVVGDPGRRYQVEATTNYLQWVAVGSTNVESWAGVPFKDPQAGDASRRFYRAVLALQPPQP